MYFYGRNNTPKMIKYFLFFGLIFSSSCAFAQQISTQNSEKDTTSALRGTLVWQVDENTKTLEEAFVKHNANTPISGYRIQLYSGSRKGAFDLKKDVLKKLPDLQTTVVYEAPDFKLQAGNYRSKLEAEKAMQHIWPVFKSAFVVQTSIDFPPLLIDQKTVDN